MNQLSMLDTLFPTANDRQMVDGVEWWRGSDGVWRVSGGAIKGSDFAKPATRDLAPLLDALLDWIPAKSGARAFF